MNQKDRTKITVSATIHQPIEKVWKLWTTPQHINQWNHASEDWHTPKSENDLRTGGKFVFTMAAKDGSFSFDFGGTYTAVVPHERIEYVLGDERTVQVVFNSENGQTRITEIFEAEDQNPIDMQHGGWQSILNNFKKYAENL